MIKWSIIIYCILYSSIVKMIGPLDIVSPVGLARSGVYNLAATHGAYGLVLSRDGDAVIPRVGAIGRVLEPIAGGVFARPIQRELPLTIINGVGIRGVEPVRQQITAQPSLRVEGATNLEHARALIREQDRCDGVVTTTIKIECANCAGPHESRVCSRPCKRCGGNHKIRECPY